MASVVVPGSRVGNYEIESLLGQGGMGFVYKAVDVRLNRTVAVKFIAPHLLASSEALRRFEREARTLSALNHPNIAILYDVGLDPRLPFMVLEYLPGGSLRQRITGRRLNWEEIGTYAVQTGHGLAHAHSHAIIHRDLKPGNVLFTAEGVLKLVDFGLARFSAETEASAPGSRSGTVAYMAPEQATGASVDHRADIFSFGVVLYELATGRVPFHAERSEGIIHQLLTAEPIPVAELRPDLPERLSAVVSRALAKRPDDRYNSVADMLRDLAPPAVSMPVVLPEQAETITIPGSTHPKPKRRWVLLLGLLLAALLSLGALWKAVRWLQSPVVPANKHIAVLPFENIGKDPANQAFCDGVIEILTSALTQMEQFQGSLLVIPATEVRSLSVGSVHDARKAFGVNLALTGSIQRLDDRIRVTVNLVDAARQRQMHSFVGEVEGVAGLQDLLVRKVAAMLELELRDEVRRVLESARSSRPGADDLCVRGFGYLRRSAGLKDIKLAVEMFQKAIARDPDYALAHAGLGRACLETYNRTTKPEWLSRAGEESQRAVQLNPGLAPAHVTLGLIQRTTGNYEPAVREFGLAFQTDPVNTEALLGLASVYEAQGKPKEAESTYRRAVALRPAYWVGHRALGGYYFRNKRYTEAEQAYRTMVEIAPENYRGYLNLGAVCLATKRYGEAERALKRSIELEPLGKTYSNLGILLYSQHRYAEAVPLMRKATELEPAEHVNWGNLGDTLRRTGDEANAQKAYRQAIDTTAKGLAVNPKDAGLLARMAVYYAQTQQRAAAVESIARAAQLAPRDPAVLFSRVKVYELTGDRLRAWTALEEALRAGHPLDEFETDEDLKQMRGDPHYKELVKRFSASRAQQK